MKTAFARITVKARAKKGAMLGARRIRNFLEERGTRVLRGEFVDTRRNIYLDVSTRPTIPPQQKLEREGGHGVKVTITPLPPKPQPQVEECLNCGNVPEAPVAVCPNCGFQDIGACPHCEQLSARNEYATDEGRLSLCPKCGHRVILDYNTPLILPNGKYNEPVVIVRRPAGSDS